MSDPLETPLAARCTHDRRRWIGQTALATSGLWLAANFPTSGFGQDADEIPPPESLPLVTKDQVPLRITYYKGLQGKKSIPLVMVHDLNGQRGEFNPLALYLQKQGGFAVVTVDLRGHGESNRLRGPNGAEKTVTPDSLKPVDFENMVKFDLERVKKFLVEKNNEGELNVNQTGVIAAGQLGTVLAYNWVKNDWSWPDVAGQKQGRDVQGMVFLSPALTFKTLKTVDAINSVGSLSTMLVGGRIEPDLKTLQAKLKPKHPAESTDPEENIKNQSLWVVQEDTELKGINLFKLGVPLASKVLYFLDLRFVKQAEKFPWAERKKPV
ncbi:MAG: alpha/beta hydrolase [Planctomycetota bacterium]